MGIPGSTAGGQYGQDAGLVTSTRAGGSYAGATVAGSITARYPAVMSEPIFNPEQAAIWELHLAAANVYRKGRTPEAKVIAEIADAAERVWLRRSKDDRS